MYIIYFPSIICCSSYLSLRFDDVLGTHHKKLYQLGYPIYAREYKTLTIPVSAWAILPVG
jgi:hypothetical protein